MVALRQKHCQMCVLVHMIGDCSWHLPALIRELRQWEQIYNTVRPHQALGQLTPQQFLLRWQSQRKE